MEPILKWAGGKRQLLNHLLPYINNDRLNPVEGVFYEPFVGGGSLCFRLESPRAVINDYNPEIANVYIQVRDNPQGLIELLSHFHEEPNPEEYYGIRDWDRLETYRDRTALEKAARIIYLNRTCYNGLYRVNRNGQFNTPFGFTGFPYELIERRILAISRYLNESDVRILNADFSGCVVDATDGDFVYFDPPYDYEKEGFTSYVDVGFSRADLERLKNTCDQLVDRGCSVLVSNNETTFVVNLFNDGRYHIETIQANRSINSDGTNRNKVNEVLIYGGD
jgi:DNA adenine methylase